LFAIDVALILTVIVDGTTVNTTLKSRVTGTLALPLSYFSIALFEPINYLNIVSAQQKAAYKLMPFI